MLRSPALQAAAFTLVVIQLFPPTAACTSVTNVAGGKRVNATTTKHDQGNIASYAMEFSFYPFFSKADYKSTRCLATSEYQWSVDLKGSYDIQYTLLLSKNETFDADSFLLEFGQTCCTGSSSAPGICFATCNLAKVVSVPVDDWATYYLHNVTCLDDVTLTGEYVTLSRASSEVESWILCGLKLIGCHARQQKVFQNVALGKPTRESSTFTNTSSDLAVDGNRIQAFKDVLERKAQCTHTMKDTGSYPSPFLPSWWRVDLGQTFLVSHLVIYNRVDKRNYGDRLRNFTIRIELEDRDTSMTNTEQKRLYEDCYYHDGPAGSVVNLTCLSPMCGRYVRIVKEPNDTTPLTLCEVEVYAFVVPPTAACTSVTNVAGGKRVNATTTKHDQGNIASYAMEFSFYPFFSKADYESTRCLATSEYQWSVDLKGSYDIQYTLLLSKNETFDADSFLLEFGQTCCTGSSSAPGICFATCNLAKVVSVPVDDRATYYLHNVTCLDDITLTGEYVTLSRASSEVESWNLCGLKVIGCNAQQQKVLQNVALGKATRESSTLEGTDPHLAVDGNRKQGFKVTLEKKTQCTHTRKTTGSWWRVDLGQTFLVSDLVIYNRVDGCNCGDRLRNFTIRIELEDRDTSMTNAEQKRLYEDCYYHDGPAGSVVNVTCLSPVCGRYVRIVKGPNDTTPLTLCEVEVYAFVGEAGLETTTSVATTWGLNTSDNPFTTGVPDYSISSLITTVESNTDSAKLATKTKTFEPDPTSLTIATEAPDSDPKNVTYATEAPDSDPTSVTDATEAPDFDPARVTNASESPVSGPKSVTYATEATNSDPVSVTTAAGKLEYSMEPTNEETYAETSTTGEKIIPETTEAAASSVTTQRGQIPTLNATPYGPSPKPAVLPENALPCKCRCTKVDQQTDTAAQAVAAKEAAKKIARELLWEETKGKGKHHRKKNSASDDRPSSKYIGVFSVLLMSLVGAVVVLPDAVGLVWYIVERRMDRHETSE